MRYYSPHKQHVHTRIKNVDALCLLLGGIFDQLVLKTKLMFADMDGYKSKILSSR